MATPKDVRVEYSVETTINTGDFQNIKPGFKISAAVPDGENPTEVKKKLVATADKWIEEAYDSIIAEVNWLKTQNRK